MFHLGVEMTMMASLCSGTVRDWPHKPLAVTALKGSILDTLSTRQSISLEWTFSCYDRNEYAVIM